MGGELETGTHDYSFIAIVSKIDHVRLIFDAGFSDYISFPFIEAEIIHRFGCALAPLGNLRERIYSADPYIQTVCAFMAMNVHRPITLKEVIRKFNTNHNTMNRKFSKQFGVGPMTWLRQEKLRLAAARLLHEQTSITEIATSVGYDNPMNFSTAFRKQYGVGPSAYRSSEKLKSFSDS